MAKKKCPECPKGAPKWMTTFSDMTTLLLTFFVLLLSMANFDKVKIEQSFGILAGSSGIMNNPSVTPLRYCFKNRRTGRKPDKINDAGSKYG